MLTVGNLEPRQTDRFGRLNTNANGERLWSGFPKELWDIGMSAIENTSNESYEQQLNDFDNIMKMDSLKNIKSIDFNFDLEQRDRNKLLAQFPDIIEKIVDKIDFNDKWMVFYKYKDVWRSRKLDEVTSEFLLNQAQKDCNFKNPEARSLLMPQNVVGINMVRYAQEDYDFTPMPISSINTIRFVNIGSFNKGDTIKSNGEIKEATIPDITQDEEWNDMKALKAVNNNIFRRAVLGWYMEHGIKDEKKIPKKVYDIIGGSFWKWTLNLPINLERYMIFNELNDRTVKIMEEDNCLIYACKQYGLPQDIIDHMKDIIKCKYFRMTKLKQISEETGVSFYVEEKHCRHHQYGPKDNKYNVPLLLFENHYMLNERVKISPYYVKHINEINSDKLASKRPLESKQLIDRFRMKNGKKYYCVDQSDYPLRLVLKTIFEVGGFEPIKMGNYLTYASTLYKYKLDPLDTLDYNPKFCCKLKKPYERRNREI